jgi:hypothetical protein
MHMLTFLLIPVSRHFGEAALWAGSSPPFIVVHDEQSRVNEPDKATRDIYVPDRGHRTPSLFL